MSDGMAANQLENPGAVDSDTDFKRQLASMAASRDRLDDLLAQQTGSSGAAVGLGTGDSKLSVSPSRQAAPQTLSPLQLPATSSVPLQQSVAPSPTLQLHEQRRRVRELEDTLGNRERELFERRSQLREMQFAQTQDGSAVNQLSAEVHNLKMLVESLAQQQSQSRVEPALPAAPRADWSAPSSYWPPQTAYLPPPFAAPPSLAAAAHAGTECSCRCRTCGRDVPADAPASSRSRYSKKHSSSSRSRSRSRSRSGRSAAGDKHSDRGGDHHRDRERRARIPSTSAADRETDQLRAALLRCQAAKQRTALDS